MSFFQAKTNWLLSVVFYVLVGSFTSFDLSVTGSFNASLMATFDKTTEEECMSKCSMVLDCTFLEYNEGTCKTFKYGTEVHDLDSASKTFAYSFDEEESSCPTATVSRPQSFTKMPTAKKSIEEICNGTYELAGWEAVTKKSLIETPDDISTCLFSPLPSKLDSCTLIVCSYQLGTSDWTYTTNEGYSCASVQVQQSFACAKYSAESPYAIAQYLCGNERHVAVVDTEANPNSEFPNFKELTRNEYIREIFYVPEINCSAG